MHEWNCEELLNRKNLLYYLSVAALLGGDRTLSFFGSTSNSCRNKLLHQVDFHFWTNFFCSDGFSLSASHFEMAGIRILLLVTWLELEVSQNMR